MVSDKVRKRTLDNDDRREAMFASSCQKPLSIWTVDCLTSNACYISFTILLQRVVVGYFGSRDITCYTFTKGHSLAIVQNMIDSLTPLLDAACELVFSVLTKDTGGACGRIVHSLRIQMLLVLFYCVDTYKTF